MNNSVKDDEELAREQFAGLVKSLPSFYAASAALSFFVSIVLSAFMSLTSIVIWNVLVVFISAKRGFYWRGLKKTDTTIPARK